MNLSKPTWLDQLKDAQYDGDMLKIGKNQTRLNMKIPDQYESIDDLPDIFGYETLKVDDVSEYFNMLLNDVSFNISRINKYPIEYFKCGICMKILKFEYVTEYNMSINNLLCKSQLCVDKIRKFSYINSNTKCLKISVEESECSICNVKNINIYKNKELNINICEECGKTDNGKEQIKSLGLKLNNEILNINTNHGLGSLLDWIPIYVNIGNNMLLINRNKESINFNRIAAMQYSDIYYRGATILINYQLIDEYLDNVVKKCNDIGETQMKQPKKNYFYNPHDLIIKKYRYAKIIRDFLKKKKYKLIFY